MRRLILILLIALGLAPGIWLRTPPQLSLEGRSLQVTRLNLSQDIASSLQGPLAITGAWHLSGDHHFFGGFSALAARGDGTFLAGSDRGWGLAIPMDKNAPQTAPLPLEFLAREKRDGFELIDLEALSWDTRRKYLWAAYEHGNVIERIDADGMRQEIRPIAMSGWTRNSGAETLVALPDGRVLVISEAPTRYGDGMRFHEALLFPEDMLDPNNLPTRFLFVSHKDYRPVDAAMLPNGKVAILLRRVYFVIPPSFDTAIMVADPGLVDAGRAWTGSLAMRMTSGTLTDNYEGIVWARSPAVSANEQSAPQNGALFLISDDNFASFQRTLLLRLEWKAE